MQRHGVWLTPWEWGCCGAPFTVGDEVTFAVTRPQESFEALLGAELAARVTAVESHHDKPGDEKLRGTVRRISLVTLPHRPRRIRRPGPPFVANNSGIVLAGNSASVYASEHPTWVTVFEPVSGHPTVTTATRVPPERTAELPASGDENQLIGYLVEIDAAPGS